MGKGRKTEVRIDGPVRPDDLYVVIIKDREGATLTSAPAALDVCIEKVRQFNHDTKTTLAYCKHYGPKKRETT